MSTMKPPTMQRSRGQLATAYAPHSLFTFEGGSGACMALSASGNRTADLSTLTKRIIGEQIQEYFEAWATRAGRGLNLRHPVPLALAVDGRVLSDDVVRVRVGDLAFQVPENVGYVPFPLAFTCTRCGLHRECKQLDRLSGEAARFRQACPTGAKSCADDWQQIDVVLTHWSGEIEGLTPNYRHWVAASGDIREIGRCASCEMDRFYLRRPPGALAGWHFECVQCRTVRPILQRDTRTLELLGPLIAQNQALIAEINMEPVSYRASAAYYPHGDRLLVFDEDRYLSLLGTAQTAQLEGFLATTYGYPPTRLDDAEKGRLLRAAGRGDQWDNHVRIRDMIPMLEATPNIPQEYLNAQREELSRREEEWNASVFAGHQQATPGIARACRERQGYVRRFDPVRMAAEHATLVDEKLRGGQMSDGKEVSVDVTILDDFLIPDGLTQPEIDRMRSEVSRRCGLLGLAEMRLIRDIKVCEYSFAYTRTSASPTVTRDKAGNAEMPVRLRLFDRVQVGDAARHPVLCLLQSNEGFYLRLDEAAVLDWLATNGIPTTAALANVRLGGRLIEEFAAMDSDPSLRFSRFLDEYRREHAIPRLAYPYIYTLLHTMAHHLIGVSASMSGLDLGSFGEHIFVPDLAFLVYRRGMTMDLGNLSSMWRDRGDPPYGNEVLDRMVNPISLRCGSESVCNHRGGACPDCILIPESACITRNELLSRSTLIGRGAPRWDAAGPSLTGYYEIAARHANARAAEHTAAGST
ncbi:MULTISPECIES: hypothetical protein [Rhizobium]|uniref:DUF1998 domain-containing protein n=1 Tax=Rhizobium johnstonii (strain DSM 114642 / LMG 32736 / 3841) TaxID=216596 RepID=Q1M897_RHIJ3|nr:MULTISPECIES: hypothetical protein [Rhizobium]NEI95879.1 hypothetical protein [Rhizobium leguminosarum]NEJ81628.1 hypothetical protein [Rhizobium leguminosarum]CAK10255.1 hypothetical protein pRL100029 [Rhizobium johnstonii 3841]